MAQQVTIKLHKTASIITTIALVAGIGIVFFGLSKVNPKSTDTRLAENVEMRDGVQYVTINARGGYEPKVSLAQSNIPTRLVVKTNGTYDCSASLVIRSIGYHKILPNTGEEIIDLGTPKTGTLRGLCGMGMYNFAVNFK